MAMFETSSRNEVQAQDASSLEDIMLEACHPRCSWLDEYKFKEVVSPWCMGENSQVFIKQVRARAINKEVPS